MPSTTEASLLVRVVAEPRPVGDSVKAAIGRAATRLNFKYGRTREIWYKSARRIDATEMDRLRLRAAQCNTDRHINSLLALRNQLAITDAAFHAPAITALDDALRALGHDNRA